MAVKKHKLVADNQKQLDLVALANYFQLMNEQSNYLPQSQELVKHCQDIFKCLSRTVGTEEQLWQLLQPVEEFLLRIVTSVHCNIRHQILIAILDKFYSYISDPQSDLSPATAAVLVIIEGSDEQTLLTSARWIVNQREDEPSGSGHRSALSRLYHWLYEWHGTPALGTWLLTYIKALEENQRLDILIDTSLENVANLFLAVSNQVPLRRSYADVIFHVLASLRESTEAFDRISPHVGSVLETLASESGQWSRHLLQNLVDILTAMIEKNLDSTNADAQESFKEKYSDVISCLGRHISSGISNFVPSWCVESTMKVAVKMDNTPAQMIQVGLVNLGNTCYMNSVFQALFAAKAFSTFVMLRMNGDNYWSDLGDLFAKMHHSVSPMVTPIELYKTVRPPFFKKDLQHDSSEFLSYLFQLLRSNDSLSTSHTPVINAEIDGDCYCYLYYESGLIKSPAVTNSAEPQHHVIPGRVCNVSGSKRRQSPNNESGPPRKRLRTNQQANQQTNQQTTLLSCSSFIEYTFGGSLLTRVKCNLCHSFSISRDAFYDLQLSFPEKLMDKTHSVQSLLEYYCTVERMSGENRYQCRDCRVLRDADRSVCIDVSPRFLVLVLKSFQFDPKSKVHAKLMHTVSCNHSITLPTVQSPKKASYDIFAAVIHSGTDIDSGHYYTVAKNDEVWYRYNDSEVTLFDEKQLNDLGYASTPYILFYKRSDVDDVKTPSLNELPRKLRDSVKYHNKRCKKLF